ncbi:hypothetical protein [Kaistella montana]|uniref:TFIIB-type zinc ribbon-containing protein n=1 Tax=Kaistella montana TaxID=1849733 RepID=A0ABW5K7U0_9FLAO|nr:hypothetical protein [Kaistella montana]MCQ4035298.1 hypothetical protein [Kaistella montana]
MQNNRFQDENKRLTYYQNEVLVVCPVCTKKAVSKADTEAKKVRMYCENCGYNKEIAAEATLFGITGDWIMAAHHYFGAELWLQFPFKNEVFWSYNYEHLAYLEQYISATLREHKDRSHFTLLEKLPKFYHEAKNRDALLKIIKKLKNK